MAGVVIGLAVLGPGLGSGALLNLDLVVTPTVPVPPGLWGLGPGLTQRVPLFGLLALGSSLAGGPTAVKVALVAGVAAAFVGAARLVRPGGGTVEAAVAGLFWAAGPFAVLRIEVGHLGVVWALAVLPWVLPRLCRPSSSGRSTFLAVLAASIGGPASGTLALVIVGVALLSERHRRPGIVVAAAVSASLVWVLPTASILWSGAEVASSDHFATRLTGPMGWLRAAGGGGFWLGDGSPIVRSDVGLAFGGAVLGLAVLGAARLDRSWRTPARRVAVLGLGLAVCSSMPVLGSAYARAAASPLGAPLREAHRFVALWLLWAAPAAGCGVGRLLDVVRRQGSRRSSIPGRAPRLGSRGLGAAVVLIVLALMGVGWSSAHGVLRPVRYPDGWEHARGIIRGRPGTVLVLPWSEYPPLSFAFGRQVFDPVPDFLGGDVLGSYDPAFDNARPEQEQVDRRADAVDRFLDDDGRIEAEALAGLGVRWVFVRGMVDAELDPLAADPGLRARFADPEVTLFEVLDWVPPATFTRPLPPIIGTQARAGSVLPVAAAPGWVRGWGHPAGATDDGRLVVPGGSGPLWFWPGAVIVFVDVLVLAMAGGVLAKRYKASQTGHIPR